MRIIFMGSPDFALPTLEAIVAAGHEVRCVYTQPPRAAGRGKGERRTAVHARAEALGLAVRHPVSMRGEVEQSAFAALEAEVAVVAAYGLILPPPVLAAPRRGCVNVHGSLLPRWRGAAPVQRAILAGDWVSGVTIMQMEEGLDTGPMLLRREVTVDGKDAGQLTKDIAEIGADAMVEWLADPGRFVPETQPIDGVTYAAKIDKAEARIDWTRDAVAIERQVRAFAPAPGAWFEAKGERVKLLAVEVVAPSGNPGQVLDDELTIGCGAGALRPVRLQRAGRGVMTAGELLRGFPLPAGTMLS
ncbi:MAG: methionyl-tRNA formyltransferase [Sphingomicrobium sp.]